MQRKILASIYLATALLLIATLYLWTDILMLREGIQTAATLEAEIQSEAEKGSALQAERQKMLKDLGQTLAAIQGQLRSNELVNEEEQPPYQQLLQDARRQVANEKSQENRVRTTYRPDPVATQERLTATIRAEYQFLLQQIGLDQTEIDKILDVLVDQLLASAELEMKRISGQITDEEYREALQIADNRQAVLSNSLTPEQMQALEAAQQQRLEEQSRAHIESEIYKYASSLSDETKQMVIDGLTRIELKTFIEKPPGIPTPRYFQRLYQGKIDALNEFEGSMASQLDTAEFNILQAYLEQQRRNYQLNLFLNGPKQ